MRNGHCWAVACVDRQRLIMCDYDARLADPICEDAAFRCEAVGKEDCARVQTMFHLPPMGLFGRAETARME